jgi:hypothetical protein
MLLNLDHEALILPARYLYCMIDLRQFLRRELHVYDRPRDLHDFADCSFCHYVLLIVKRET